MYFIYYLHNTQALSWCDYRGGFKINLSIYLSIKFIYKLLIFYWWPTSGWINIWKFSGMDASCLLDGYSQALGALCCLVLRCSFYPWSKIRSLRLKQWYVISECLTLECVWNKFFKRNNKSDCCTDLTEKTLAFLQRNVVARFFSVVAESVCCSFFICRKWVKK